MTVEKRLTYGSLFTGIGGLDLGFDRSGMQCCWQIECEPYCNRVLARHWPNVRRWLDVRTWPQPGTEWVDVICGGPPCQPISHAGKRQGANDPRWLWGDAIRCIGELRPQWAVFENPAAILGINGGREFERILRAVDAVGYDAEWDVLPAAAFGAGHERQRMFLICYPNATGRKNSERIVLREKPESGTWWLSEPGVCRVVDGVSSTVDAGGGNIEVAVLANAVVPQISEWIGRRIIEAASK